MIINTGQRTDIPAFNHHQMTKQDLIGLLIIHDAAEAISEAISSVFGEIGEEEGRFGELLHMSGNYEERSGGLLGMARGTFVVG